MAKRQELQIAITALNEATAEFKKLNDDLKKTKENSEKAQKGFKGLNNSLKNAQSAIGKLAGVAGVLGATAIFAKEGVAIQKVAGTFDALSQSVGASADFMERLQVATGGAVSNVQLMEGANKVLGLQLATTDTEAVNLIETAVKLGSAFGDDAATSIENFSLLLANQSIPRLDSFGISSGKVRERIAELTTGVNAMDKETAFMTATMEEAEKAIQRLGLEGDAASDSITRVEIKARNAADEFKRWVADGIIPVVDGLTSISAQLNRNDKSIEESVNALVLSTETFEEYEEAILGMTDVEFFIGRQQFNIRKQLNATENLTARNNAKAEARSQQNIRRVERESRIIQESLDDNLDMLQLQDESEAQFRRNQARRRNEAVTEREMQAESDAAAIERTIAARKAAAEEGRRLFQQEIEQINAIVNARQIQLGTDAAASLQRTQTIQQATAADATFTDELLQQASALGITATQFVLGAEATGLYTEEQIRAALAEAALKEETARLAAAVANNEISIQSAIGTLQDLEEKFRTTTQSVREMASEIDRLPSSISIGVQFVSGELVLPSGADGGVEGSRAHGGHVSAGSPYLVGEQGREIFIPNQSGTIVNNTQTEQMLGGNNITINVNSPMMATPQAIANSVSNELGRRMRG